MNDRMITTAMSAKIVSNLLKKGWTVRRIAKVIGASQDFIEGVRAKRHVFTVHDIEGLAQRNRQSFNMMIVESFPITRENRSLIESTRNLVRTCENPIPETSARLTARKRRPKAKAN